MRFAGFAILFFVTFLLFVITLLSSFGYEPIMVPLLVLVITGFVIESVRALLSGKTTPTDRSHFLKTMVAVMAGAIGAYIMNCSLYQRDYGGESGGGDRGRGHEEVRG